MNSIQYKINIQHKWTHRKKEFLSVFSLTSNSNIIKPWHKGLKTVMHLTGPREKNSFTAIPSQKLHVPLA